MSAKLQLKRGEAKRITFTVKDGNAIVNLTGTTLFLGVKKDRSDTSYAFSKSNDEFNVTNAATGIVSVFLTAEDTDLDPFGYIGELRIFFSDEDGTIEKSGDLIFEIKEAVTP